MADRDDLELRSKSPQTPPLRPRRPFSKARALLWRCGVLAGRLAAIDRDGSIESALAGATERLLPGAEARVLRPLDGVQPWAPSQSGASQWIEECARPPTHDGERQLLRVMAAAPPPELRTGGAPLSACGAFGDELLAEGVAAHARLVAPRGSLAPSLPAPSSPTPLPSAPPLLSAPPFILVVVPPAGTRFGRAERAALTLLADAAGYALERRRLSLRLELLRDEAEHDFLTGVFNRRLTMRLLERELRKRQRSNSPLSLVMIDLDSFKSFNDAHGHLAGDEVLRGMASVFASAARATDIVGRFGGEEFLVALPDTAIEDAVLFAERLRQDVVHYGARELTRFGDQPPTISIGICSVGPHDTLQQAIERADRALYESKHRGRNCFSLSLPEDASP